MNAELPRSPRGDLTLSGFVAAACVAVLLVGAAYWLSLQQNRAAGWVNHSHEVLATIARTRAALVDIQNGHRGFTISGREADLDPYARARAAITIETDRLRALLADHPEQQQRLAALERGLAARLATAAQLVEARRAGGFEAAKSIVDTGLPNEEMAGLRSLLNALETDSEQLLRARLDDHGRRLRWFWVGMAALVTGLFAALAVLYLQVRRRRDAQQALLDSEQRLGQALRTEMNERLCIDEELQRLNRSLETLVRERTEELRSANDELREAELRMRDLSSQLIAAQEQERRRIARELHDDTGQLLSVMRMHLSDLLRGAAGATERLPECIAVVDSAIARIRAMALNLRPTMLDDLGLADALQWALAQQAKAAGWKTEIDADDLPVAIPADVQTACFRIGQEALANAARHAGATHVKLSLRLVGRELELTVRDNGSGFDLAYYQTPEERRKHFGVMSMTERASLVGGTLDIDTGPGCGTRISVRIPIQPEAVLAG